MTEPRHRHIQLVPGQQGSYPTSEELSTEDTARAIHRKVADQLSVLTDEALIARARQIAQDFKEPSPNANLTPAEWALLCQRMLGDVSDQVFGITVIGGPRPARQARAAIERAIGLLLVLDDSLRELEDDAAS